MVVLSVLFVLRGTCGAQPSEGGAGDGEKPEIVITYTREATPADEVAGDIQVVTRKEIENMPATTAAEVLQKRARGLRDFCGRARKSRHGRHPGLYGTPGGRVPGWGSPQHARQPRCQSFAPALGHHRANRKSIKAPPSSAWGSAMGGVINIITREPTLARPFSGELTGSCGDEQTCKGTAAVSGTVDRLGYYLSGSRNSSNGFMPYTDYSQVLVYGKLNYFLSPTSRVNFACNYDAGRNADPTPYYPDFWDDVNQHRPLRTAPL